MGDFYSYLIKTNHQCVQKISEKDIYSMECVVLFGTRSYDLVKKMVDLVRQKNVNIKIILVVREYMISKVKEFMNDGDVIISHEDNYSDAVVDKIQHVAKRVDGVFFYTIQKHDLGNFNLLNIACMLNENAVVYGINKEEDIYEYTNLKFYVFGLRLYLEVDEYMEQAVVISSKGVMK